MAATKTASNTEELKRTKISHPFWYTQLIFTAYTAGVRSQD
ncbi:hypothetical protein [Trichormus azollae]|nr:hypothetical protein [Trichormus azollae]